MLLRFLFYCTCLWPGSPTEILYSLKTFGIPVDQIPSDLSPNCSTILKNQIKWCEMNEAKDNSRMNNQLSFTASLQIIQCPGQKDILLGKGRQIMKHPGNIEMRLLLESKWHEWENATNQEKAGVARSVLREIKDNFGRFLKEDPNNGWFIPVDDETARQKISIGFRDLMKRKRSRQQSQTNQLIGLQQGEDGSMDPQPMENSTSSSAVASIQHLESDTYDFIGITAGSVPKRRRMSSSSKNCFNMCS